MTFGNDDTTGLLKISGTLDIDAANALREALLNAVACRTEASADLSEVDGCDTAALQVLLAGQNDAASRGRIFCITALSASVAETAEALGFSFGGSVGRAQSSDAI